MRLRKLENFFEKYAILGQKRANDGQRTGKLPVS
jgi:hypothetical protein